MVLAKNNANEKEPPDEKKDDDSKSEREIELEDVPTEREQTHMISMIPQFTYIRNEQHFRKNRRKKVYYRKPTKEKQHSARNNNNSNNVNEPEKDDGDDKSQTSFATYRAMPEFGDPRGFRSKSNMCKSVLNFDKGAGK